MGLIARDNGPKFDFTPHPDGSHAAVMIDVVDYGEQWNEKFAKMEHKICLVFFAGEYADGTDRDGNATQIPLTTRFWCTLSFGEKANLRKFVQNWFGKTISDDKAREGIDLEKLIGRAGLINVQQYENTKGETRDSISTIMPLPKGMTAPEPPADYVRVQDREGYEPPNGASTRTDGRRAAPPQQAAASRPAPQPTKAPAWMEEDEDGDGLPF